MVNRFRKILGALTVAGLMASMAIPAYGSGDVIPAEEMTTVFVELSSAPLAAQTNVSEASYLQSLETEKANLRKAAKGAKIRMDERYSYSHLFNGVSAQVPVNQVGKLSKLAGVKAVYPVITVERPETTDGETIEPDMATAVDMTGASQAGSQYGLTGKGITVAIIDTGIDYTHPDLGNCTAVGPDCRVKGGYDFVGDSGYGDTNWTPVPDNDPMDRQSHGTHVAGIVGAKGQITGVAPGVDFMAYKVFDMGSSSADVIIAAMEMALRDGVDVVNMSLGAAFQWPQYPTATAANNLVNKGVTVIASAGNSGREGIFSQGAPSLGEKVIAVASFDNSHSVAEQGVLADGTTFAYSPMTFSPDPAPMNGVEIVAMNSLGCTAAEITADVAGKVAMVNRGVCAFSAKAASAAANGAVGLIVANNVSGLNAGTLGAAGAWIPTVTVSLEDGNLIRSKGATSASFTGEPYSTLNPAGGLISDFSSWGLSPDLTLKPDVGAPGGSINSTVPVALGSYGVKGGTSMSAPHVAGAAALLLEAQIPGLNSQNMRFLLQNTAKPVVYSKTLPFILPTHRQGAGQIDIIAALNAATKVEPSKLSLKEMAPGASTTQTLTIENKSSQAVTYTVGHQAGLSTGPMNTATNNSFGLYTTAATVTGSTVTVPAGGSADVTVTITAPNTTIDRLIFSGWITIKPQGSATPTVRVPYAGLAGEYQNVKILDRNGHGFPWLSERVGTSYQNRNSTGMAIDLSQDQAAYLLVNFAHQAEKVRIDAVAANGKRFDRVYEERYRGRHASPVAAPNLSYFSPLAWDGTDWKGAQVPNGEYTLILSVLKPLGDETNPAHWQTFTSNTVTVTGSNAK